MEGAWRKRPREGVMRGDWPRDVVRRNILARYRTNRATRSVTGAFGGGGFKRFSQTLPLMIVIRLLVIHAYACLQPGGASHTAIIVVG